MQQSGLRDWCLEIHDLWLSKAVAMRSKNIEFCRALIERDLVVVDTLRARLPDLPDTEGGQHDPVADFIDRLVAG